MSDATVKSYRRYCLLKRRYNLLYGDEGLAAVWRAKQEAVPSTALPPTFPALTKLTAAGYTTKADLDGADQDELVGVGLTITEATAALAALAQL
jgi:hypothetical protein